MLSIIKKVILFFLSLIFFGAISYFLYQYTKDDIKIVYNTNSIETTSRNTAYQFFSKITVKSDSPNYITELESGSLEEISPEELALYQNEGEILYDMEKYNSKLIIGSILVDGKIFDGENAHTLSKGFWHFPLSKAPGKKGNTVIIGHRYDKMPPATDTFFNLDKVVPGDKIIIKQDNQDWSYTVSETKVVSPNERSILAQTNDYRLTLITCHPLWSSKERFVVIAKLDKVSII